MLFAGAVLCLQQARLHLTLVPPYTAGAVAIPILWTRKLGLRGFGDLLTEGHSLWVAHGGLQTLHDSGVCAMPYATSILRETS